MMTQAFYSGLAGLQTHQKAIDISSSNIANVNTVGYREYNAEFASLFEENLHTTQGYNTSVTSTLGYGSRLQASVMNQSIGAVSLTDRSTDLMIDTEGWFGVAGNGETYYTRAGNFYFDAQSNLVSNEGNKVLGTLGGNINGDILTNVLDSIALGDVSTQAPLSFPNTLSMPAVPTTQATFAANLGIEDVTKKISVGVISPEGIRNNLELTFTKSAVQTAPNTQWDVEAKILSLDGETVYETQTGTFLFSESGAFESTTLDTINHNGVSIALDFGTGFDGMVAINGVEDSRSSSANGMLGGDLIGYEVNTNAEVIATFTNGAQSSVGQIAVYHFQNDQGLQRVGNVNFQPTSNSGEPIFYKDAQGNNILGAQVKNYQLENSNVRLETALTELIVLQRAFDANSKSITTADELIQKAINMRS